MFKIKCEKALASKCKAKYKGIAFDGCSFFLTEPFECRICKFDLNLQFEECFDTCRGYTYFCFDQTRHCFWATTDNVVPIVYRLNECFEEIERIEVKYNDVSRGIITGISFNCCNNSLVVSFATGVVEVNLSCVGDITTFVKSPCKWIMSVVSVCPYTFCLCYNNHKQTICIYSDSGNLIDEIEIPISIKIESAVFVPCVNMLFEKHFYLLITKQGGYPYIYDCVIDNCLFDKSFCRCNYDICCKKCDSSCDCKESCNDILQSIALVERAIAHILNAEGEKLQKVIASTDCIGDVLAANKSVRRTIERATHLEMILFNKMDILREICCFCDEEDCNDHKCENGATRKKKK